MKKYPGYSQAHVEFTRKRINAQHRARIMRKIILARRSKRSRKHEVKSQ